MIWSEEHEFKLCREIVLHDMYQHKHGSHERGQCLDRIAKFLTFVTTIWFKVDQRALKDKIKNLLEPYVTHRKKKKCFLVISPEHTELDDLLQKIYKQKKESEGNYYQHSPEKEQQINSAKEAAEDMLTKDFVKLAKRKLRIVL